MSQDFVIEQEFFVRYAETDAMGFVHHSSYVIYLEEARSHYSRERGYSYAEFEKTGYFLIVSELEVRYLTPARYGEQLRLVCWIDEMKSRRLTFAYEVRNAETDTLLARAKTSHLCVDSQGKLTILPTRVREWGL